MGTAGTVGGREELHLLERPPTAVALGRYAWEPPGGDVYPARLR
ncbi:hypothetical protein [Mycolicibacterium austroafricanum]|nr:hypothetical protein [Mycolicibacterium austroafricanum]